MKDISILAAAVFARSNPAPDRRVAGTDALFDVFRIVHAITREIKEYVKR